MNDYDYIIDAFSRDGNNTNLEVDNLTVGCISSKNNNFSLDSNGNLTVNSITTSGGGIDFDRIYPVGSIYMSISNTNPGTLFGGTWEAIRGKFLLSEDANHVAGTTGGEETHQLTNNELPKLRGTLAYHGSGTATVLSNVVNSEGTLFTPGTQRNKYRSGGSNTTGSYSYDNVTIAFGNNEAHNNMPPYLAVYMWKRVS